MHVVYIVPNNAIIENNAEISWCNFNNVNDEDEIRDREKTSCIFKISSKQSTERKKENE